MNHPGFFVVVEGPEGSGKSTLVAELATWMDAAGLDPVRVREPGGTPVAEGARRLLLDPEFEVAPMAEVFLYLAARADVIHRVIRPALEAGRLVLADRFDLSTEIYQIVGRGLDREMVLAANRAATGGLRPDLVLVTDVPPGVGLARQQRGAEALDRLDLEDRAFHQRVIEAYLAVGGPAVRHLDGTLPPEGLFEAAREVLVGERPDLFAARDV
jgi:dTMP kinase